MFILKYFFQFFSGSIKSIFRITKKVALVLTVFGFIFVTFTIFSSKNKIDLDSHKIVKQQRADIYQTINQYSKTNKTGVFAYKTMNCILLGEACTDNPNDGDRNTQNSVIGMATGLIKIPFENPPASGTMYALQKFNDAGLFPNTYAAQGLGFTSLTVFQPIWQTFRNLTFLIIVLILVAIGFMIMFRMKLDPHTIVSVENALPKIILTMVAITFSYAIAGFLIDLMYISIVFVINLFAKAGQYDPTAVANMYLYKGSIFDISIAGTKLNFFARNISIYFNGIWAFFDVLPAVIKAIIFPVIALIVGFLALKFASFFNPLLRNLLGELHIDASAIFASAGVEVGSIASFFLSAMLGLILAPIAFILIIFLLVILGLLLLIMRIFFTLLSCYIQVIVYIMFAPLLLLIEAVPGKSGFMPWIRTLVGNLAVFPATVGLLLIVFVISNNISSSIGGGGGAGTFSARPAMFEPPFIEATPTAFLAIINAAFLIMIPDFLKIIKKAIIGEGGVQLPIGPGAIFAGTIGGVLGGGAGALGQVHSVGLGLGAIAPFAPKDWFEQHDQTGHVTSKGNVLGKLLSIGRGGNH